ncbi:MAG: hypothetical protein ABUL60_27680 [Myxococcales bacterium]
MAVAAGACGTHPEDATRLEAASGSGGMGVTKPHRVPFTDAGASAQSGGDGGTGAGASESGGAGASASTPEAGGAGAGAEGGGPDRDDTLPLLEEALTGQRGSAALVVDPEKIAGRSFSVDDYVGPSDWVAYRYRVDDGAFVPRITLHLKLATDGELQVVVSLPTPTLPYAEELPLERHGDAWLARGVPTASHLERYFEEQLIYAYYEAAVAMLEFADDDHDGLPDRVLFAATASDEGERTTHEYGPEAPLRAEDELTSTLLGKSEDVFPSQGPLTPPVISASEIDNRSYWFVEGVTDGWLPSLALSQAVAPGSTFFFENADGERSQPQLYTVGDFVRGVKPVDPLPAGWTLVGDGQDLAGNDFHLRQPVALVKLTPVAGDFETETSAEVSEDCYGEGGVAAEHEGQPALAGSQSYYTACPTTFRILRSPGATQIKFEAIRNNPLLGTWQAEITPLGVNTKAESGVIDFAPSGTNPATGSVSLPAVGDDLLVTLPEGLWLDSLRTE